jgi:hypothetical protein
MALPTSQFQTIFMADETNALIEVSAYVRTCSVPTANAARNDTSFQTGGNNVTTNTGKGAIQSQPTVEFLWDPAIWLILERVEFSRVGSTWMFLEGENAAPTGGGAVYMGTFTIFAANPNYSRNADATIQVELAPTDPVGISPIIPNWYPI